MELKTLEPIILYAKKNGVKIFDYSKYLTSEYILEMPGEHNRQNMAAALSTLEALNLDVNSAYTYLSKEFLGTKRRMEYVGRTENGAYIYDDYAHNPEGISFLFDAIKTKFPTKKIIALFEPHLYSRTEDFKEAFRKALSLSDILYLFPVYKAREPHQPEKDFILEPFINRDKENYFKISEPEKFIEIFSEKKYDNNYVVITIGAGDIWEQGLHIKKQD
jgi:UDP-N-acetylmuramate--alanine ligase